MKFHLEIHLDDVPADQQHKLIWRLLRDAADRIDGGQDFGGFHFGKDDSTPGGFAIYTAAEGAKGEHLYYSVRMGDTDTSETTDLQHAVEKARKWREKYPERTVDLVDVRAFKIEV